MLVHDGIAVFFKYKISAMACIIRHDFNIFPDAAKDGKVFFVWKVDNLSTSHASRTVRCEASKLHRF